MEIKNYTGTYPSCDRCLIRIDDDDEILRINCTSNSYRASFFKSDINVYIKLLKDISKNKYNDYTNHKHQVNTGCSNVWSLFPRGYNGNWINKDDIPHILDVFDYKYDKIDMRKVTKSKVKEMNLKNIDINNLLKIHKKIVGVS